MFSSDPWLNFSQCLRECSVSLWWKYRAKTFTTEAQSISLRRREMKLGHCQLFSSITEQASNLFYLKTKTPAAVAGIRTSLICALGHTVLSHSEAVLN